MPSKVTSILPVRVENALIARLDALASRVEDSTRTALARDALRRGLELLEAELARPKAAKAAPEAAPAPKATAPQQTAADLDAAAWSQAVPPAAAAARGRRRQRVRALELFEAELASGRTEPKNRRAAVQPSAPAGALPAVRASAAQSTPPAEPRNAPPLVKATVPRAEGGLEKFARDVLDSARHSRSGWVASDRLYIVHAWRQYTRTYPVRPPTLAMFKTLLLQARRKGLLSLAADELAAFHRRSDVERSQSEYLGATFHLLVVERSLQSWRRRR
jgi:hypothetical protein